MESASRLGSTQTVAFAATSAAAANPFGAQTFQVRVVANASCHVRISDGAQTATTGDPYLPAQVGEYFTVTPGQRIAVVRAATDGLDTATNGTLWITELS